MNDQGIKNLACHLILKSLKQKYIKANNKNKINKVRKINNDFAKSKLCVLCCDVLNIDHKAVEQKICSVNRYV